MRFKISVIFILLLNIFFKIHLLAENPKDSNDISGFGKVIAKFYKYNKLVENLATIELSFGFSSISLPAKYNSVYAPNYSLGLRYGFTRIYPLIVPDRYYFANEFVFAENISSHLKPKEIPTRNITTDNWKFGCGYRNGYGYKLKDDNFLVFYHSGSLDWSRIDFEISPVNPSEQNFIRKYDEEFKFGTSFESGIRYEMFDMVFTGLLFERSLVFQDFDFFQWISASVPELCLQRLIDYYGDDLIEEYPDFYPIAAFILKSAFSFIVYEIKERNQYWPWESGQPVVNNNFKLGFTYLFK